MIFKCKVVHIVAVGRNGEIGKDNKMLWHIPEDFKYFKEMTIGHAVVMGRKTWEGLPAPLTRRCVHVVSKDNCNPTWKNPLISALGRAKDACFHLRTNIIWVAGGQRVYETTNDIVDEVFLTRVHADFDGADTFYKIPEGFVFGGYVQKSIKTKEGWDVTFEKWVRKDVDKSLNIL